MTRSDRVSFSRNTDTHLSVFLTLFLSTPRKLTKLPKLLQLWIELPAKWVKILFFHMETFCEIDWISWKQFATLPWRGSWALIQLLLWNAKRLRWWWKTWINGFDTVPQIEGLDAFDIFTRTVLSQLLRAVWKICFPHYHLEEHSAICSQRNLHFNKTRRKKMMLTRRQTLKTPDTSVSDDSHRSH